ncbi:spore germination protein GerPC [Pseudoneobacillus rhizosphaerae]|uniref:Spore germination protein GerPC n=1 Tax=Pseudoneobacillus rhizosphaerae TaxID=2880968 RepID=A0A9C7GB60_9BACI|nr:spore germination protein GerPC [Pseudoneobacillus rhizosphaerae]CAG9609234.1 putative spore germination protein GerPC [Pseudoneobacillus rhizosphaerae]
MTNYEFYEYIRQLHMFVESQASKIKNLETLVQSLATDLNELKSKPTIQVEKIEYKFDQLKVETLEGTLNIGLNPTDLQAIEDFAVDGNQAVAHPFSQADQFQSTMRMEESILQNIDSEVLSIIQQYNQENQVTIEESYVNFIKDDIRKQIPNRIQYHLHQIPINQRSNEQGLGHEKRIIELIKNDIQTGIYTFLNNLPNEVKGSKQS